MGRLRKGFDSDTHYSVIMPDVGMRNRETSKKGPVQSHRYSNHNTISHFDSVT